MHIDHIEEARDLFIKRKAIIAAEKSLRAINPSEQAIIMIDRNLFATRGPGDVEDILHLLLEAAKRDRHAIDQRLVDLGATL